MVLKKILLTVFLIIVITVGLIGLIDTNDLQDFECDDCNVVFVSLDTLRADRLPMYGHYRNTSPNMEELASESILYKKAFTQSPHTTPSHISMFTSLYPSQHGNDGNSKRLTMLAEAFQESGYETFGLHGGGNVRGELGFSRGFEEYRQRPEFRFYRNRDNRSQKFVEDDRILSEKINESDDPFFMFYHTYEPHDPYISFEEYITKFDYSLPGFREEMIDKWGRIRDEVFEKNISEKEAKNKLSLRYVDWFFDKVEGNETLFNHTLSQYDATIRGTDDFIGKLKDTLKEHNVYDDTILIVTSDHGEEFQDHGGWRHTTVFNEVTHVPLIVRLPEQEESVRVSDAVELVDLVPTLVDVLDLSEDDFEQPLMGQSLLDAAVGERREWTLSEEYKPNMSQVAYINWSKELEYLNTTWNEELLYNMSADFEEQSPIDNATLLEELRIEYEEVAENLSTWHSADENLRELGYLQ